eukprot:gene20476-biopygen2578
MRRRREGKMKQVPPGTWETLIFLLGKGIDAEQVQVLGAVSAATVFQPEPQRCCIDYSDYIPKQCLDEKLIE